MVITYHGGAFVRIVFGDTTIAVNPIAKGSSLKTTRFGADIALISLNNKDFNGVEQVTHGEREPFVVSGPGEYEIRRVFIKGFPSVSKYGEEENINTIYMVSLEGIHLCFLGALSSRKLNAEIQGAMNSIDVLFVPIGGRGVLGASDAHELSVELEAKIVIPVLYDGSSAQKQLKAFLDEDSSKKLAPRDKLTLKKRDLDGKEGEIIVLAS